MMISLITFISPVFGLLIILSYIIKNWGNTKYKSLNKFIFPLSMIFGVYGYSMFFNGKESDLTRYYELIRQMNGLSLNMILSKDTEFLYTKDILFYLVNLTGDVNILAFIVGFITYGITFYVLFDMIKKSKREFKIYEVFLLGIISIGIISPYSIIGNVRCVLAYSIVTLAIYREFVQEKRNILTYILYIIPIGLHSSAIIIIVIRIISKLFKSLNKLALLLALMLPKIIDFTYSNIRFNMGTIGNIFNNAINKSYYYLHWTEGGWANEIENSVSNVFFRFVGLIFLLFIIYIIIFSNRIKDKKDNTNNDKVIIKDSMINYLLFVAIVALGTLSIKTGAFWRFESIVVLFSPVIFVKLLENDKKFEKKMKWFYWFGIIMFAVNIFYQARNLTTMGYFITLKNFLTTSGIKIFFKILEGLVKFI